MTAMTNRLTCFCLLTTDCQLVHDDRLWSCRLSQAGAFLCLAQRDTAINTLFQRSIRFNKSNEICLFWFCLRFTFMRNIQKCAIDSIFLHSHCQHKVTLKLKFKHLQSTVKDVTDNFTVYKYWTGALQARACRGGRTRRRPLASKIGAIQGVKLQKLECWN